VKNRTGCLIVFGIILAALLLYGVGKSAGEGGNAAEESRPPSMAGSNIAAASVPEDDRPLIPGGTQSVQQIDAYLHAQLAAANYNRLCIRNVVRQADPSARRGDVIEAALQACRSLGQQAADFARRVSPMAPTYSDDRERQTIREVIREEIGPP